MISDIRSKNFTSVNRPKVVIFVPNFVIKARKEHYIRKNEIKKIVSLPGES